MFSGRALGIGMKRYLEYEMRETFTMAPPNTGFKLLFLRFLCRRCTLYIFQLSSTATVQASVLGVLNLRAEFENGGALTVERWSHGVCVVSSSSGHPCTVRVPRPSRSGTLLDNDRVGRPASAAPSCPRLCQHPTV